MRNVQPHDPFMDFVVERGSLEKQRTDCIVVGVYEDGKLSSSAIELDAASGHALNDALSRGDLEGELGTTLLLTRIPNAACERVLLVGLGPERGFIESSYHAALGTQRGRCARPAPPMRRSASTSFPSMAVTSRGRSSRRCLPSRTACIASTS